MGRHADAIGKEQVNKSKIFRLARVERLYEGLGVGAISSFPHVTNRSCITTCGYDGGGGATPRFWTLTTPPPPQTNRWSEAPRGGGVQGGRMGGGGIGGAGGGVGLGWVG